MCVAIECVFVLLHLLLRVTDCECARASAHSSVPWLFFNRDIHTMACIRALINSRRTKAHSQAKYINLSLSPLATFEHTKQPIVIHMITLYMWLRHMGPSPNRSYNAILMRQYSAFDVLKIYITELFAMKRIEWYLSIFDKMRQFSAFHQ